jgi:hypothetical protein
MLDHPPDHPPENHVNVVKHFTNIVSTELDSPGPRPKDADSTTANAYGWSCQSVDNADRSADRTHP